MLSESAIAVLRALDISDSQRQVRISTDLDRPLYEQVNEVLTRLGGKWSRKVKAHVFPYPCTALIAAVCASGALPPKNPTAFFPTPKPVVDEMLDAVGISSFWDESSRILEPSAGTGAIAKAIRLIAPTVQIDCCEVLPVNREVLNAEGLRVISNDFLTYEPTELYDAVLMNPPFSVEGDKTAYVTHIEHAWSLLRPYGRFAAIVPGGWLDGSTKRLTAFREFVCDWLSFAEIGSGAFAESGTEVNTWMIWGEKANPRTEPYNGWPSYHAWQASLWIDNNQSLYSKAQKAQTMDEMRDVCREAAEQLVRREAVPIVIREGDVEALAGYYADTRWNGPIVRSSSARCR